MAQATDIKAAPTPEVLRHVDRNLVKKGVIIAISVLAAVATLTYGYWGYQTIQRSSQLAELQAQVKATQRSLIPLRRADQNLAAAKTGPGDGIRRLEALKSSLLAPTDGVRALDQLTLLALRTSVDLNSMQLNAGKQLKVGNIDLDVLEVNFNAQGNLAALADFFETLQAGFIPWLVPSEARTELGDKQASLFVKASLYTLPGQSHRPPLTSSLKPGGTPTQALALGVSPAGSTDIPIIAFSVESLLTEKDALRSIRVQVSHPEVLTNLKLHAESGGDAVLTVGDDTLVATGVSVSEVLLTPKSPFTFQGGKEQRFYLTANLSAQASSDALVEVRVPVQGITFTSGLWPPGELAATFIANLLIKAPPAAPDQQVVTSSYSETPITLSDTGLNRDSGPLNLVYRTTTGESPCTESSGFPDKSHWCRES